MNKHPWIFIRYFGKNDEESETTSEKAKEQGQEQKSEWDSTHCSRFIYFLCISSFVHNYL